jgi:hypothetical protein
MGLLQGNKATGTGWTAVITPIIKAMKLLVSQPLTSNVSGRSTDGSRTTTNFQVPVAVEILLQNGGV